MSAKKPPYATSSSSGRKVLSDSNDHSVKSISRRGRLLLYRDKAGKLHSRESVSLKLDPAGRVLIPVKVRDGLNLKSGDEIRFSVNGDTIEIRSIADSIETAKAIVKRHVPSKKNLVNELLQERRREATSE